MPRRKGITVKPKTGGFVDYLKSYIPKPQTTTPNRRHVPSGKVSPQAISIMRKLK